MTARSTQARTPESSAGNPGSIPRVSLDRAALAYGDRTVWSGLDLDVAAGEFLTVLGPNGSGKSSLLRVLLGLTRLAAGEARVLDAPVRRGNPHLGYIPQRSGFAADTPLRGRDLVRLGVDGHRWGIPTRSHRPRVDRLLDRVGATDYADAPLGRLSGGEQQRLRIAQALATNPDVLLCDEPLQSLDPRHQRAVVDLLERRRREDGTTIVFVTHEITPVLPVTDRVLYLVDGAYRHGAPAQVMTSATLSELYQAPIEVLRRGDQLIVIGADAAARDQHDPHHLPDNQDGANR